MEALSNKSRDLPLAEFYSILQREFVSYFVRSKIYPLEYAQKYERYCVFKREKIEKIGLKNSLPSIFNSNCLKQRYLDSFFNPFGVPNFEYRDENSIHIMGKWDKVYWFSRGTSIKIKTDEEIVVTTVSANLFNINKVVADVKGETKQFRYEFISRIISDSLILF